LEPKALFERFLRQDMDSYPRGNFGLEGHAPNSCFSAPVGFAEFALARLGHCRVTIRKTDLLNHHAILMRATGLAGGSFVIGL
jgi:hypothetical protein